MKENFDIIAIAGNTETPAYLTIKSLGFKVSCEPQENEEEWWIAENEHFKFVATNLVELLGLIAMRQQRGIEWKASDKEIKKFLSNFYPESLE